MLLLSFVLSTSCIILIHLDGELISSPGQTHLVLVPDSLYILIVLGLLVFSKQFCSYIHKVLIFRPLYYFGTVFVLFW